MSIKCKCGFGNPNSKTHTKGIFHKHHERFRELLSNRTMSYRAIGEEFGVSYDRVRQIHQKLLRIERWKEARRQMQ